MITMRYSFWIQTQTTAGSDASVQTIDMAFDTIDLDHASELAERAIENGLVVLPENIINDTLVIFSI